MELKGNKVYRHQQNPEEKRFHDEFIRIHGHDDNMSAIVFEPAEGGLAPSEYLDEKGTGILITAMQWLGSPLGQSFLREMGYEKPKEKVRPVMTNKHRMAIARKCRNAQRSSVFSWKELSIRSQNNKISEQCNRMGFALEDFYEGELDYINRILKR